MDPENLPAADTLNKLGFVNVQRGDLNQAEEYYRRALAISERLASGGPAEVRSRNGLGDVAQERGQPAMAEQQYLVALTISQKLNPRGLDAANCLQALGDVSLDRADLDKAERYSLQALEIRQKLRPGSLEVAASLRSLGLNRSAREVGISVGGSFPRLITCPDPTPTPTPFPTPTPTPTPGGAVGPKYVVLTVTYAPPGSSSSVTYSNSTMFGSSLSLTSSFTDQASVSVTLEKQAQIGDFGIGVFGGSIFSSSFMQERDSSASIAVTDATTQTFTVRGPSSSPVGINHDEDVIWLWLNPVLSLHIPSPNTIQWDSLGFDNRDPAGELDIFPLQVKYLNGHAPIPPTLLMFSRAVGPQEFRAPPVTQNASRKEPKARGSRHPICHHPWGRSVYRPLIYHRCPYRI